MTEDQIVHYSKGPNFLCMVKGIRFLVSNVILGNRGKFENIREYGIRKYKTFRILVKKRLDKEPNYMIVPSATWELEKIEMVSELDGRI